MPDTPTLAACLRAEREAWHTWHTREHTSPPGWYDPAESALHAAQRATDEALAALTDTLAEVTADRLIDQAFTHRTLNAEERAALHGLLRALYGRGGA